MFEHQTCRFGGRVVLFDDSHRSCGYAAELSSIIAENCFRDLKAPIKRVTRADVTIPFGQAIEAEVLPDPHRLERAIRAVVAWEEPDAPTHNSSAQIALQGSARSVIEAAHDGERTLTTKASSPIASRSSSVPSRMFRTATNARSSTATRRGFTAWGRNSDFKFQGASFRYVWRSMKAL